MVTNYHCQIWRIWPAVLLHTLFAAGIDGSLISAEHSLMFDMIVIVTLSVEGIAKLAIPNVMLTVLGMLGRPENAVCSQIFRQVSLLVS